MEQKPQIVEKNDADRRQIAQEVVREMRKMRGEEDPTEEPASTTATETASAPAPAPQWEWSHFSSWPLSMKFAPAAVALLSIFIAVYYQHFAKDAGIDMSSVASCRKTFDYGFRINAAKHQSEVLSTRSWEIGMAAEALGELVDADKTVFGADPFPNDKVPYQKLHLDKAVILAYPHIVTDESTLFADNFSVSDPASLGVAAIMTSRRWEKFLHAAQRQKDYLLNEAPRYSNGAISHRIEVPELWSDAVSMVPPFLAYLGVANNDTELVKEAVRQCELHRDVLLISSGPKKGLWKHIVGPSEKADDGAWSTGNAWAAYGMARVRATISGWRPSNATMRREVDTLDQWIGEILDGAIKTDNDESGLLRNYLGDDSWFGETSGTALLAATAYRMAVLKPEIFAQPKYELWAHKKRQTVFNTTDEDGFAQPAVNPLEHDSRAAIKQSPEGESFLLMLGSAWRDCVCAGVCTADTNVQY